MKLSVRDGRIWMVGIEVIDRPLPLDQRNMEKICSRWNAFEKGSLMKNLSEVSEDAIDVIEHLHDLLGYQTEEGVNAVIAINRIFAEINYR